ncbi:adenylyltransferase/cytidyltransferase family protein [Candidatus Pacearchaeota archaeon]|nr:adenylyltransferase/cytidyltransferase family protein [Candidatus Pacearchaeota archaeon]
MSHRNKIKNEEELLPILDDLKNQGKKIVHCHGCFDLLHPGHIRHFEFAKSHGDILVVSITGDDFMNKGYKKPFATEILRAENLASIIFIDYVIIDKNEYGSLMLSKIRPDVYMKGMEYSNVKKNHPGFVKEKEFVESYNGKVVYSPDDVVFSSTNIMNELLERNDFKKEMTRNFLIKHKILKNDIIKILNDLKQSKILIVGDIFFEDRAICESATIDDESPVFNLNVLKEERYIRGVYTIGKFLSELNIKVDLLFIIGNDKRSIDLINDLNKNELLNINYVQIQDYAFPIKRKFLLKNQKMFEVNIGNQENITSNEFIVKAKSLINISNGVIICDHGYGSINNEILDIVSKESNRLNIPSTIIHSNSKNKDIHLSYIFDFLINSEFEARNLTNNAKEGIDNVARTILSTSKIKNLLLDLGKEGIVSYARDKNPSVGFLPSNVDKREKEHLASLLTLAKSTGGDIFIALYIADFLHSNINNLKNSNIVNLIERELSDYGKGILC